MIKSLGIRREDKSIWERRVPLVPADARALLAAHPALRLVVQPSSQRVHADDEWRALGAALEPDLAPCDVVLGVKEMPASLFRADGIYMFFSHTIKGQDYNMPMLRRLLEVGASLIDYERIVDDQGRRLVFFGRYAGLAGMIDTLWALGQRLKELGHATPFAGLRQAYTYRSLDDAKAAVQAAGAALARDGLPAAFCPLVIGFAGYGNVSRGAQEICDLLPHREVAPPQLAAAATARDDGRQVIKVVFHEEHTVRPRDPRAPFDRQEFFAHPERYAAAFRPRAEHLSVLVNCIYWQPASPRLLTRADAREMWAAGARPKPLVVGDISCDIDGGVEFCAKATQPDHPVYVYEPAGQKVRDGVAGHGPVVMAVDNLPCELPAEASQDFSHTLQPFLPALLRLDPRAPLAQVVLPQPLRTALLAWRGELTAEYTYLKKSL